jgi:hypothetical protein
LAYGSGIWHTTGSGNSAKGIAQKLAPKQSKCLRVALGAYRATPIRSLETSLNIPPLDLYLTAQKAVFYQRLEASGMALQISQACQKVKTHLRKRGLKTERTRLQPDLSEWINNPQKQLQKAWKERWNQAMTLANKPTSALNAADYPVWGTKGSASLSLYKNLKKADASILTQLRTGKIGLGSFLYQIGARENPECTFCGSDDAEDGFHLTCRCIALNTPRTELSNILDQDISAFSYKQFLEALSNKKQAKIIAKWFRNQELIAFYQLSLELEPD